MNRHETDTITRRLESIANPGQIIFSTAAYEIIQEQIIAKEMPPVKVKGKAKAAVVYALIGLR
jgi:class 3 adenylate cyclase